MPRRGSSKPPAEPVVKPHGCDYEIWGVSAQGGDFNDKEDLKRLQSENDENFVYVVDNNAGISKDLTKLL